MYESSNEEWDVLSLFEWQAELARDFTVNFLKVFYLPLESFPRLLLLVESLFKVVNVCLWCFDGGCTAVCLGDDRASWHHGFLLWLKGEHRLAITVKLWWGKAYLSSWLFALERVDLLSLARIFAPRLTDLLIALSFSERTSSLVSS